ncbi:N-acetylmuramoyl-L-alanine amidase [Tenuibacillus multivorans]|uniref:N-acetylmuramoyl-L-alanine amidase n=1 Tax=Tenuibacillus multivorans TaxID=237069 RepID=A0A1H0EKI0_9BACI|nr:N-acetylmuramoyl-L-alanine amidase [Tenuibacillus multivorans]GEL77116.1 hypothetical protein TMU01_13510 [Tenuibacillus multivorans]SDN82997.1 N-acetylmuramoyl-L-alanine amidase [Tenuibacillus multivorans]
MKLSRWIQDAGHGGTDPGAIRYGQNEKLWALEAALFVHNRLQELGIETAMTRTEDVTLPNSERTHNVRNFDKAISHHFNAGGGNGAEFIHSIHASGEFEQLLKEEFKQSGYPFRRIFTRRYPDRNHLDYYYMHRETGGCRVTIVEYDFLDGPNRHELQKEEYRVGMYESVVKAICREEGVSYQKKSGITAPNLLYRVIAGSFRKRQNAETRAEKLRDAGFEAYIERYKS